MQKDDIGEFGIGDPLEPTFPGERKQVGEFEVSRERFEQAERRFQRRSPRSRALDKAFRGPVPKDYETWEENMDRYDYPGVDTPTDNPSLAVTDFPSPSGRSRISSDQLATTESGIDVLPDGGGDSTLTEYNAALDSLADAISNPFNND